VDKLQAVYVEYCKGVRCRDELWVLTREKANEILRRLLRRTHVQKPKQEIDDLLTDSVCVVMKRLDKKEPIGRIGGVVYYAVSNRLRSAKYKYEKQCSEVFFSDLPYCDSATD